MDIELVEAGEADRPALENLAQLYAYDFSEILGVDADNDGRFDSISLGDWPNGPDFRCFLVRVGGHLAGFALVHKGSALTDDPDVTDVDEFFVMRKYRRRGVGTEVARRLFDMFPGRWEVREVAANVAAQAFWRRVIGDYAGGRYEERLVEDERWQGPVQSFTAPGGA